MAVVTRFKILRSVQLTEIYKYKLQYGIVVKNYV